MIMNILAKIGAFFSGQKQQKLVLNPFAKYGQNDQFISNKMKFTVNERSANKTIDLTKQNKSDVRQKKYELKRIVIEDQNPNNYNKQQYMQCQDFIQVVQNSQKNQNQVQKLMLKLQTRKQMVLYRINRQNSSHNGESQSLQMIDQNQKSQSQDQDSFIQDYKRDVIDVLDKKYSGEIADFPQITIQNYAYIRNLWKNAKVNPNQVIRQMKNLKMIQKLTLKTLKTLSFGSWLNDQIINGYLQLMENRIGDETDIKICNSFFAITTLSKSPEMIQRTLRRKNITNKNVILIALNTGNHWFFTKIRDGRVYIYDSVNYDTEHYQSMRVSGQQIFKNIIKFANWFYNQEHRLEVSLNYPKQNNNNDCGMFLLCGIKDTLRNYSQWSFSQSDMRYKRIIFANEIMNEQISGFLNQKQIK